MADFDALFDSLKPQKELPTTRQRRRLMRKKCDANSVINTNGEFICHKM